MGYERNGCVLPFLHGGPLSKDVRPWSPPLPGFLQRHNLLHVPTALEVSCEGVVLARLVHWPTSLRSRSRGLLGLSRLEEKEALVLSPAKQIHTFGMAYPIDVLFCDRSWHVRHVCRSLSPNRITRLVVRSRYVIELPAGTVPVSVHRGSRVRMISSVGAGRRG